jgi:hypothetical protein
MRAASDLPRTAPPERTGISIAVQVALLLSAMLCAGVFSVFVLKQDANWDLQNYHFYNGWAFVHGRLGWDLAPAQLQTFHNPLIELPFFWMVNADWPPQWISFVLALPAGLGAFFLGKIVVLIFADLPQRDRRYYAALAFAVGITATSPVSILGTTINEWQGASLVMIALWLVLRRAEQAAIPWRTLACAGALCGAASGLKLTAATYALGLGAALLLRRANLRRGVVEAVVFGLGVTAGLLLTLGPWMWTLYSHFESPLFPYYNDILRSPWWDFQPLLIRAFGPHTLLEWLTFPLHLFRVESGFVTELEFSDWRLPLLYLIAIAGMLIWIVRRLTGRAAAETTASPTLWRTLFVFWMVSFVTWTALHSIYRYLLPLELLFGALTIHLLRTALPRWSHPAAALVYAALAIVTTHYVDWWHIAYGDRWFRVDVPPIAANAVVLLTTSEPMAYVLPFFPPDGRFLGASNNLNDPGRTNQLEREIAKIIREHRGPLYSLTFPAGAGAEVLAAHNLRIEERNDACASIRTNMLTSPLQLCRLRRTEESNLQR